MKHLNKKMMSTKTKLFDVGDIVSFEMDEKLIFGLVARTFTEQDRVEKNQVCIYIGKKSKNSNEFKSIVDVYLNYDKVTLVKLENFQKEDIAPIIYPVEERMSWQKLNESDTIEIDMETLLVHLIRALKQLEVYEKPAIPKGFRQLKTELQTAEYFNSLDTITILSAEELAEIPVIPVINKNNTGFEYPMSPKVFSDYLTKKQNA